MKEQQEEQRRGIPLRFVIVLMFIAGIAVSGLLLSIAFRVTEQYSETKRAEEDFLSCQNAVYVVRDVIDELSERARNFVVTGKVAEVTHYFDELQTERSMEKSLEVLKGLAEERAERQLNTAIQLHNMMAKIQCRAMRLAAEAYGLDVSDFSMLAETELTEEERSLSTEEQLKRALDMLFDLNYTHLKGQVDVRIRLSKESLMSAMTTQQQTASRELERLLHTQRLLIAGMVATLFLVLIFVMALVVYPLYSLVKGIQRKEKVTVRGSSEINFLAATYNRMREQMEAANARLSYEAAHDALTGLYNRSAFEELQERIKEEHIALLIMDVDFFKQVNDSYGHDMGDRVLKRVARVLLQSFREADKVCRIGGDEFSVIVIGVGSSAKEIIREKLRTMAETLRTPEGDVPGVTLSVGCAFSDQLLGEESIFKKADRALYHVKKSGRNNCAFYGEQDETWTDDPGIDE